uniref:Putative secreted protein n=1 Tax=Rhipicephalus microplus TaxID=6941 RepID=A0A6G5A180_RHIMP
MVFFCRLTCSLIQFILFSLCVRLSLCKEWLSTCFYDSTVRVCGLVICFHCEKAQGHAKQTFVGICTSISYLKSSNLN